MFVGMRSKKPHPQHLTITPKILASIKETEMVEDLEYHILILYEAHNGHFAAA